MKEIKKVEFGELKKGQCFRLTKNGPIYQKGDFIDHILTGKNAGKASWDIADSRKVYPTKIKITEVK